MRILLVRRTGGVYTVRLSFLFWTTPVLRTPGDYSRLR
jgi:hypothetical protein